MLHTSIQDFRNTLNKVKTTNEYHSLENPPDDAPDNVLSDVENEFEIMIGMLKAGGCPLEPIQKLYTAWNEFSNKVAAILDNGDISESLKKTKKFNGKEYLFHNEYGTMIEVNAEAKKLKEKGFKVQIVSREGKTSSGAAIYKYK